jgi:UDP-glucose 6-dehydrogenase
MPNILIIGKGNVGQATARSLPSATIDFHDPYMGMVINDPSNYSHAIVCVDTLQRGPADYQDLDSVLSYLNAYKNIVVVRSTIDPDKAQELFELFGDNLIIFPEFMDHNDFKSQRDPASRIVLGGTDSKTREFFELLGDLGYPWIRDTFFVSHEEASIIKLSSNAALATKIIMFNAIYKICNDYGVPYDEVRKAIGADSRIGLGHTLVPSPDDGQLGFGGHCLPKDIEAISNIDSLGFFNFISNLNKRLGRS